jgi:hypothetical protein
MADDLEQGQANNRGERVHFGPGIDLPLPEIQTVQSYWSLNGFVSVILAPFLQGMFYAFGEGLSYWSLAKWLQVDAKIFVSKRKFHD